MTLFMKFVQSQFDAQNLHFGIFADSGVLSKNPALLWEWGLSTVNRIPSLGMLSDMWSGMAWFRGWSYRSTNPCWCTGCASDAKPHIDKACDVVNCECRTLQPGSCVRKAVLAVLCWGLRLECFHVVCTFQVPHGGNDPAHANRWQLQVEWTETWADSNIKSIVGFESWLNVTQDTLYSTTVYNSLQLCATSYTCEPSVSKSLQKTCSFGWQVPISVLILMYAEILLDVRQCIMNCWNPFIFIIRCDRIQSHMQCWAEWRRETCTQRRYLFFG